MITSRVRTAALLLLIFIPFCAQADSDLDRPVADFPEIFALVGGTSTLPIRLLLGQPYFLGLEQERIDTRPLRKAFALRGLPMNLTSHDIQLLIKNPSHRLFAQFYDPQTSEEKLKIPWISQYFLNALGIVFVIDARNYLAGKHPRLGDKKAATLREWLDAYLSEGELVDLDQIRPLLNRFTRLELERVKLQGKHPMKFILYSLQTAKAAEDIDKACQEVFKAQDSSSEQLR